MGHNFLISGTIVVYFRFLVLRGKIFNIRVITKLIAENCQNVTERKNKTKTNITVHTGRELYVL